MNLNISGLKALSLFVYQIWLVTAHLTYFKSYKAWKHWFRKIFVVE